jgi:hypothetical protein
LAQSRKRKKERRRAVSAKRPAADAPAAPATNGDPAAPATNGDPAAPATDGDPAPRGYARSRAKNEAARAALKPLAPGERPTAVTVGAIVAALLAAANLIAVIAGWDGAAGSDDRARAIAGSLLVTGLLCVVAWGMWHAKYWAVLGMQTLLALTLIAAALGLVTAENAAAMLVLVAIIVGAGTLFWFMVKAMARIQMPERPSRAR